MHPPQELRKAWVGRDILVTVREVSPERRKVLIDMQQAAANQLMKTFAVRALSLPSPHPASLGRNLILS
jgi:hypothetical protein